MLSPRPTSVCLQARRAAAPPPPFLEGGLISPLAPYIKRALPCNCCTTNPRDPTQRAARGDLSPCAIPSTSLPSLPYGSQVWSCIGPKVPTPPLHAVVLQEVSGRFQNRSNLRLMLDRRSGGIKRTPYVCEYSEELLQLPDRWTGGVAAPGSIDVPSSATLRSASSSLRRHVSCGER